MQDMIDDATLTTTMAKSVFEHMFESGTDPDTVVTEKGMKRVGDSDVLVPIVEDVLKANVKAVEDYQSGTATAVQFLVGQVMKATRGAADPNVARSVLLEYLDKNKEANG